MIIVGKLILAAARNPIRKTKIKEKKRQMLCFNVARFCLSCHGYALWTDASGGNRLCWLVWLLHVCMCPCAAHTNTQTNVKYGAFEEWSLLTEPQHQPVENTAITKKTACPHPEDFGKTRRGTCTNHWGWLASPENNTGKRLTLIFYWWLDGLTDTVGRFYSQQHTPFTSILASEVNGCNQLDAKGKHHDIPQDNHFTLWNHEFIVWFYLNVFAQKYLF